MPKSPQTLINKGFSRFCRGGLGASTGAFPVKQPESQEKVVRPEGLEPPTL